MDSDCAVCAVRSRCKPEGFVAFIPTPILRGKVEELLNANGVEFALRQELFAFEGSGSQALTILKAQLNEFEQKDVRIAPATATGMMKAHSLAEFVDREQFDWFDDALVGDKFSFHYQPIVDTSAGSVMAHECLVRLTGEKFYNGGQIVDAAVKLNRVHEFDGYCRGKAIRSAGTQARKGSKVFINFMPSSIYDPALCLRSTIAAMHSTDLQPSDIVFEVVESDEVRSVGHLGEIARYYQERGFGFALDDVGSGSNSLQMICDFRPDFIKLDKSMTDRIDDPMRLAAVRKITELAVEFGVSVIAEGVETAESMRLLESVGITQMQGWYFGKPAPQMHTSAEDLIRLAEKVGEGKAAGVPAAPETYV